MKLSVNTHQHGHAKDSQVDLQVKLYMARQKAAKASHQEAERDHGHAAEHKHFIH
jgi:hypothetical protein